MGWVADPTWASIPESSDAESIRYSTGEDGRITLVSHGATLQQITARITEQTGITFDVDPRIAATPLDLQLEVENVEALIRSLSGSTAIVFERGEDGEKLLSARITAQLDEVLPEALQQVLVPPREGVSAIREPWVLSNADRPDAYWQNRQTRALMLQNAWIDTESLVEQGQALEVPAEWAADPTTENHIVQFSGLIGDAERAAIESTGASISHYVPHRALAVKATAEQLAAIRALDTVYHVEPYHPYFKLSHDIVRAVTGHADSDVESRMKRGHFNIVTFAGDVARADLEARGYAIVTEQPAGDRVVYSVTGQASDIASVAHLDTVQWVETTPKLKAMNDLANKRVRARSFKALLPGVQGEGVIVAVTDSGIDFNHPAFAVNPAIPTSTNANTRIVYYDQRPSFTTDGVPGDNDGHGTHVSGSILGNGALSASVVSAPGSGNPPFNSSQFAGIAPKARIVAIEDFNSFTDNEQASISWTRGARISNNSWGNSAYEYGALSLLWDTLVRDAVADLAGQQELIAFFAAGNDGNGNNDGTGALAGTIGQPGNAKNVITVGAVELPRRANNFPNAQVETDTDWQIASYSSRGPVTATDRRVKPDIVAPGSYVLSVQSKDVNTDELIDPFLPSRDYRAGNINSGTNYAFYSGTSMATPIAAGAGALFYQYYTNTFQAAPSPAMMKAALVAGARMINSLLYELPSYLVQSNIIYEQGWGLVDINRSALGPRIQATDKVVFFDQSQNTPVATGQYVTRQVTVQPGQGSLKIVLAWTDPAGAGGNAVQLINDLDLIVLPPGGGGYLGNRFSRDGVHSYRYPIPDPIFGDAFNNVEVITIKDPPTGTYSIQVFGYQVPVGPQNFAMVIQQGIGIEGRTEGDSPAIALDNNDQPVIAYSDLDEAGFRQIFVKRWVGEAGDLSEIGEWKRLDDQWFGLRRSASDTGVSLSIEDARRPSIAVGPSNSIFVAWEHYGNGGTNIYLRKWDGSQWTELGDSARNLGISGQSLRPALQPVVRAGSDGLPVVAWRQSTGGGTTRVFVVKWNGSAWIGLDNSHTNGVGNGINANNPTLTINSSGNPVVAWQDSSSLQVHVWQYNGATWVNLGNQGTALANQPDLASGPGGDLYLTWLQAPFGTNINSQVFALRRTGGSWVDMGGSSIVPGISSATGGVSRPAAPKIAYAAQPSPRVVVAWLAGTNNAHSVLLRQHNFSGGWTGVGGAGDVPGIARLRGSSTNLGFALSSKGVPSVVFENNETGLSEVQVYQQVLDISPPSFAGLQSAVGGTNNNVVLAWQPAIDNFSTSIVYRIYRGTSVYNCFDIPMCSTSDVFGNLIATVTNVTSFTVTGMSNYQLRCYAVRAVDASGFADANTVMQYAAPKQSGVECDQVDSDGDGMPDWWEFIHFGSITGAAPGADPDADGLTNLQEFQIGTDPLNADSDGDGLTDGDEVNIHQTNPARADSDGDGLDDAFELAIGSDPRLADSNNNGLSDGDVYQLGYNNPAAAVTNLGRLLVETFESTSTTRTNWTKVVPNAFLPLNYWHLSTAEPVTRSNSIFLITDRSTNTAYRFANDLSTTNPAATYNGGLPIVAGLDSPRIDATGAVNLFVAWKEFHATEPNTDFMSVQARSAQQTNWVVVSTAVSGLNNGWSARTANLTAFAGNTNVQVRFLFTANSINNDFAGWYIDDVVIYQGVTISGWVRNVNGEAIVGAEITAIGRGGVTNVINGHRVVAPGKVFGRAVSANDGSYQLVGLPMGSYYVKSDEASYRSEFYNGVLFSPTYGFGNQLNAGVFSIADVGANGYISLVNAGSSTNVHFELELGESRSSLGVAHTGAGTNRFPVNVNGRTARIWNGSTNTPAFINYQTATNFNIAINHPDWLTNAVAPTYFSAVSPGPHQVGVTTNNSRLTRPLVEVREGEYTSVNIVTNNGQGFVYVASLDGIRHPIYLNGIPTGSNAPALLKVQAGEHMVSLVPANNKKIAPQYVQVPVGGRTNVGFSAFSINTASSSLLIEARDVFGNAITGANVVLNGLVITTNDLEVGASATTPVTLTELRPGVHRVSIFLEGYRQSSTRYLTVSTGTVGYLQFALRQADEDFDRVGDATEISGYTNIFLFNRNDDPDNDGLTNYQEFELFRNFGLVLNPFSSDTDGDGMRDGDEVGYDGGLVIGDHVLYAQSRLATNAVQYAPSINVFFRGRYLEGIANFAGTTQFVASIDGDRFVATAISHSAPPVPTPNKVLTTLSGINSNVALRSISFGHQLNAKVFGDTDPVVVDTDGDGMWDGFEFTFRFLTNANSQVSQILDPIGAGENEFDPDFDGLSNEREFLGFNNIADILDWSNPASSDSDGDQMPDGWEYQYGLNPVDPSDAFLDADFDNLPNYLEYLVGSNPLLIDTDADGVSDGDEVLVHGTDPTNPDTDGDGLFDGLEIELGTNPNAIDTDGDGMPDGFEVLDAFGNLRPIGQRLNPLDPTDADEDYDGDGLTNLQEYFVRDALTGNHPSSYGMFTNMWYNYAPVGWNFSLGRPFTYEFPVWDYYTDPFNADSDGDGIPDGYEVNFGLHPMDPIPLSDNSTLTRYPPLSTSGDLDLDGLWNEREFKIRFALDGSASTNSAFGASTDPWNPDTDGDGLVDGFEHHSLFGNPTLQDTDGDRLMDGVGVPGKFGEVMSERKFEFELVPCPTGCTWLTAFALAQSITHPVQTGVRGHLAVITDAQEYSKAVSLLTGSETSIALGFADLNGDGIIEFSTTSEPFLFHNFATNEPNTITGAINFVYMTGDSRYAVADELFVFDYFLVEFPATSVTNHYDQATNDMWQLVWPVADTISRPYWVPVPYSTNSIAPPPRWGHAMVYNPAFERKARSFNGEDGSVDRYNYESTIVLDNRKLVVIGGADGVDRYSDIWEFSIRSNEWRRSVQSTLTPAAVRPNSQGLHSGVSDLGAVLFMGYLNTKSDDCDCINQPWNCDGEAFGEPKNRPWNYGFKDSSFDQTYIIGGWNEQNEYLLPEPMATLTYKSTDDPDPVAELNDVNDDQSAFSAAYGLTVTKFSNNVPSVTVSSGIHGFGQLAVDDDQVPVGNYTRTYTAVENPGPERTERSLVISNLAAGIRFAKFPFVPDCDIIAYAGLRLDVSRKPDAATVFTIIAEFDEVPRTSREYSDGGELLIENTVRVEFHHPWTRLNRPFNSAPLDTVFTNYVDTDVLGNITPNAGSSILELDVTSIVNELITNGNWSGQAIGFIILQTNGTPDYALIRDNQSRLHANWLPSYKVPPQWRRARTVQTENAEIPSKRKSFGLAYAHVQNRLVLFGGINGNQVFGDTYEARIRSEDENSEDGEDLDTGSGGPRSLVGLISWTKIQTVGAPPARWGHSMVYEGERDEDNAVTGGGRVLMFGGFDVNNQPLNDLWEYDVDNDTWTEIVSFQDNERPSPRGGAMMAYYGGEFYKRNAGDSYRSAKRRRVVLFGGTDGKNYYNDTWVFYRDYNNFIIPDAVTGNRWTLVDPGGEQSIGPSPRAFGVMAYAQNGLLRPDPSGLNTYATRKPTGFPQPQAYPSIYLFGGRTGTLPKGPDTDKDLVPDGMEHEIGGPAAGRDPRVNALVNPDGVETVPFNIKKFGAYQGAISWLSRSHLADLEVVSYNERNEAWRSQLFTWQGWPIETSLDGQSYIIADETQIPFETPYTDRVVFVTGVDALSPDWVNMWYHRHGEGDPNDERDVWELGVPDARSQGAQAAPPYARSGRWVYGTGLRSSYPNNARMELFTPKFDLTLPVTEAFTNDNANSFFLVFHEWLNLADPNDVVRVEVIRPSTPADINTRVTGQDKQTLTLVPSRNNSHNTTGDWRRVIVPLNIVGNETNLYIRFTLQSDNQGVAGGWYLDDIAILQGAEIVGTNLLGGEMVTLLGVNSDIALTNTMSDANGLYMFGLLPLGQYQVVSGSGVVNPIVLGPGSYNAGANIGVAVVFNLVNFTVNANTVTWDAIVGEDYQVQYNDTLFGPWTDLGASVTAASATESIVDPGPIPLMRFYRVLLLNQP
ncbi:MAG TPA: S8 family serine peptidase [Kiritimatiellia bacterium]|nr:S8 family serine peptidase [Kiritimatiellia bacterium]HMP34231.1 S8 family serine peptidase [Kiritimatiellia bacterium]